MSGACANFTMVDRSNQSVQIKCEWTSNEWGREREREKKTTIIFGAILWRWNKRSSQPRHNQNVYRILKRSGRCMWLLFIYVISVDFEIVDTESVGDRVHYMCIMYNTHGVLLLLVLRLNDIVHGVTQKEELWEKIRFEYFMIFLW